MRTTFWKGWERLGLMFTKAFVPQPQEGPNHLHSRAAQPEESHVSAGRAPTPLRGIPSQLNPESSPQDTRLLVCLPRTAFSDQQLLSKARAFCPGLSRRHAAAPGSSPRPAHTHCVAHWGLQRCVLLLLTAHVVKDKQEVMVVCEVGWDLQLELLIELGGPAGSGQVSLDGINGEKSHVQPQIPQSVSESCGDHQLLP